MRKFLWDGGASIAYSLAAVFFLASSAHNAEAGQKNAKTDQADQAPTTDKPRSTDFKATVSPKREALVHIDLGRVLETQGDYEGAVAEYANAVEVCKRKHSRKEGETPTKADYSLAHRRMAGAFDRMGDFQRSEMHYREALKLSPNDAKVWNDAGYSYYLQNRWPDAERSLKMAVKLDNQTPKYHINLGLAFAASGKTNEAVNELASVVGPAAAHANVGFVLAGRGNRRSPESTMKRHFASNPTSKWPGRCSTAWTKTKGRVRQPWSHRKTRRPRRTIPTFEGPRRRPGFPCRIRCPTTKAGNSGVRRYQ